MAKNIVITCTLDTYSREISFVKRLIEQRGHRTILIDLSMRGQSPLPADITCEEVAQAGGATIEEIRASHNRQEINRIMTKGALKKVKELQSAGKLDGIIAIGGATNAFMATSIMKHLPFGVPKFVLSSSAAVFAREYFGTKDITLMDSVIDIINLNDLGKSVLTQAAGAICGMVESSTGPFVLTSGKPAIALSLLGNCESCARYVMEHLEQRGYQVLPFHAQGIADRLMEELIERGFFDAVIDISTGGIVEELFGGVRAPGPQRLEAAGKRGIPQIIAPSSLEFISLRPSELRPEHQSRKILHVDDIRVAIRTNAEELIQAARVIAAKLNKASGPVKFLIPLRGWSTYDGEGRPLDDPEANKAFVDELRRCLRPEIELREIDAWIEDPEFARAVVAAFDEVMGARRS